MKNFEYRYGALVADLQTFLWPGHIGHRIVGRKHIFGWYPCAKLICSCGEALDVTDDQIVFDLQNTSEFDAFVRSLPLIEDRPKTQLLLPAFATAA